MADCSKCWAHGWAESMSLFGSSVQNTVTYCLNYVIKNNRKNRNRLQNMTKTEYKDINKAPEKNNFNFFVLKGYKNGFSMICPLYFIFVLLFQGVVM